MERVVTDRSYAEFLIDLKWIEMENINQVQNIMTKLNASIRLRAVTNSNSMKAYKHFLRLDRRRHRREENELDEKKNSKREMGI